MPSPDDFQVSPVSQKWRKWLGGLSGERRLALSITHIAFSNGLRTLLTLIASLLVARILGPELMGHYATARLIAIYLVPIHFGAPQGVEQRVPILRGGGDTTTAADLRNSVYTLVSAEALFFALFGFLVIALRGLFADATMAWVLAGGLLITASTMFVHLVNIDLNINKRFRDVSIKTLGASIVTLASLPMLLAGLAGAILRQAMMLLCEAGIGAWVGGTRFQPKVRTALLRVSIRIGFPVMAMAFLQQYMLALDRTLVRALMGSAALGVFSIATVVSSFSISVSQALMNVLYPTVGERFGKSNDARQAASDLLKPVPYLLAALAVVVLAGVVCIPFAIRWFLPSYAEGIPSAQLAVVVCGCSALGYTTIFYYIVRKMTLLLAFLTGSILVQLTVSLFLHSHGWGLVGFMTGTVSGTLSYALVSNSYLWLVSKGKLLVR